MLPAGTCVGFLEGLHRRFLDFGDGVLRIEPGRRRMRIVIGKIRHGLHIGCRARVHCGDGLLQLLCLTKTVQRRLLRGEMDIVQGIIEELDDIPRCTDPLQLFRALGHHDPVEIAAGALERRTGERCIRIRILLEQLFDIARRSGQDQLLLGARHRDIEHAKLLAELVGLQLFPNRRPFQGRNLHFIFEVHIITADAQLRIHQHRFIQRACVELPAHTREEDHRELQALRLMDRHDAYEVILIGEHRRLALVTVVLLQLLDVADVVEEPLIRGLLEGKRHIDHRVEIRLSTPPRRHRRDIVIVAGLVEDPVQKLMDRQVVGHGPIAREVRTEVVELRLQRRGQRRLRLVFRGWAVDRVGLRSSAVAHIRSAIGCTVGSIGLGYLRQRSLQGTEVCDERCQLLVRKLVDRRVEDGRQWDVLLRVIDDIEQRQHGLHLDGIEIALVAGAVGRDAIRTEDLHEGIRPGARGAKQDHHITVLHAIGMKTLDALRNHMGLGLLLRHLCTEQLL